MRRGTRLPMACCAWCRLSQRARVAILAAEAAVGDVCLEAQYEAVALTEYVAVLEQLVRAEARLDDGICRINEDRASRSRAVASPRSECEECGRAVHHPESVATRLGPSCAAKRGRFGVAR